MAHLTLAAEPQYFRGQSLRSRALGLALRHTVRPLLGVWAPSPVRVFPPNLSSTPPSCFPSTAGTVWRSVDLAAGRSEWLQAKGSPTSTAATTEPSCTSTAAPS